MPTTREKDHWAARVHSVPFAVAEFEMRRDVGEHGHELGLVRSIEDEVRRDKDEAIGQRDRLVVGGEDGLKPDAGAEHWGDAFEVGVDGGVGERLCVLANVVGKASGEGALLGRWIELGKRQSSEESCSEHLHVEIHLRLVKTRKGPGRLHPGPNKPSGFGR
ncbi:MAG: hypothetical protein R2729_13675 [Bryobacteraceae bacterium]